MNIAFYNFTKRRNSTKLPAGTGTIKDCKLKDNCSVHNPVILLANSPVLYDYAYIQAWSRYYFVEDIISVANGLTEYHLVEDVLASNKTAIGTTKAMIAYSSTGYHDFIIDPRCSVSTVKITQTDESPAIFTDTGHFIVTVFNSGLGSYKAAGMCSAYYCTDLDLIELSDFITSESSNITAYFNGNLLSAIASINWVPYTIPSDNLDVVHFKVGNVTDQTVWTVNEIKSYSRTTGTTNLQWDPVHPNDFRRSDPYSKGILYLPGIGNVNVNLTDFTGSNYITVRWVIEQITGDIAYYIENSAGRVLQSYFTNLASPIPIGNTTTNIKGALNSTLGMIGGTGTALAGIATGNIGMALGGAGAAVASASSAAIAANQRQSTVSGGMGSRGVTVKPKITLTVITMDTEDITAADYISIKGRPVGEVHQINTHSGFIQTIDAHVALNATAEEMDEVNRLLDGGIYYE